MTLTDTHCHLHRPEFDPDRDDVLERAQGAGVTALLDPATDLNSNRRVVVLAERYPAVYAAIGLHPHHAQELTAEALDQLRELAQHPKVVAVGEIGLDYYRNLSAPHLQREAFGKLLRLSQQTGKPVILHCREAYAELLAILRETLNPPIRGLMHCFAGDLEIARQTLDLGLFISFAGNLTFPKAQPLRDVAREVPLEKVLLETDAPFLSPQAYRGKRNEPAYLMELVKAWGRIQNRDPEEIAQITTANAQNLFGLAAS